MSKLAFFHLKFSKKTPSGGKHCTNQVDQAWKLSLFISKQISVKILLNNQSKSKFLPKKCRIFVRNFKICQKIIQKSPKFLNFSWKSAIWWPKNAFFVKILISVNFFFKIHVFQTFFERSVKIGPFSLKIFLKKAFWAQKIAFFHLNFQKAPSGGQNLHFSSFFNKDWRFSTFFLFAFLKEVTKLVFFT